jgi:hypothetical protein
MSATPYSTSAFADTSSRSERSAEAPSGRFGEDATELLDGSGVVFALPGRPDE